MPATTQITHLTLQSPSGDVLRSARQRAGLNQVEAATLMGYPLQPGSRGGLQSRTWQAMESSTDARNMPAPIFALFQLLTGQHPDFAIVVKPRTSPAGLLPEPDKPGLAQKAD